MWSSEAVEADATAAGCASRKPFTSSATGSSPSGFEVQQRSRWPPLIHDVLPCWKHVVETVDLSDLLPSSTALESHEGADGFPWSIE